jgi:hypothetical protein
VTISSGGGGGGGSSSPRCELFRGSDTSINAGERVTLRWETRRGSELRIEDDRNNEIFQTSDDDEVDDGEVIVRPVRDTRYTLTVERGSRDDTCTVRIDVGNQNVSLILDRDQQPLTSISLTRVPYTGFDAGPLLKSIFYTLLGLWSMSIAYVLVIKKGAVFGFVLRRKNERLVVGSETIIPHTEYQSNIEYPKIYEDTPVAAPLVATVALSAPTNLPTAAREVIYGYGAVASTREEETNINEETENDEAVAYLEARAHRHNLILSSDAIRLIIDQADSLEEQESLLDEVAARAKEAYPREDGWTVLNRERIAALFAEHEAAPAPVAETHSSEVEETVKTSLLAEAIVTGNIAAAYAALGNSPMIALADAAADLDIIFRARRGDEKAWDAFSLPTSDMLVRAASHLTSEQIESAIGALTTAIDGIYQDEAAAVKLAVMKAIKATA